MLYINIFHCQQKFDKHYTQWIHLENYGHNVYHVVKGYRNYSNKAIPQIIFNQLHIKPIGP